MELEKELTLECTDLNHDGDGVCRYNNFLIFVEGMLIGEKAVVKIIKQNKSFANGIIKKLIIKSSDRVEAKCKNYKYCGGCEIMHLEYSKQLEFKLKMVKETLKRIGHLEDINVKEIIGMDNPYFYRNKVQIPFSINKNNVICGFYKKKTHQVIPLDECYIEPVQATEIAKYINELINRYNISAYDEDTKKGSIRHLLIRKTVNNEYMVVFITKDDFKYKKEIVRDLINKYPNIKSIIQNVNKNDNNIILGDSYACLYGKEILEETLCGLKFKLSHQSFFQTNHEQTEKLYKKVLEYANVQKNDVILDSYCGVGTISLLLATKANKVYGVEIVNEAIKNAKENAKINNLNNLIFIAGKSEEEIIKLKDVKFNTIVVDPPRKGLDKIFIDAMLQVEVPKIVYVSCDPATLSRDLSLLSIKYDIKEITLVDMFPHSTHVESVVLLNRR